MILAIALATISNILYRVRNNLAIKPIYIRIMHGALGFALYVIISLIFRRKIFDNTFISFSLVYFLGYYTEMIIEQLEDKLPEIINRIIDKFLGEKKKAGVENDKFTKV